MPALLADSPDIPLSQKDVTKLWQAVLRARHYRDEQITVRCVDETTMQKLNREHRGKDAPTNVLTYSYSQIVEFNNTQSAVEHDVALCLPVAKREAQEKSLPLRDYIALLMVHAFLHATGMDHEKSADEAQATHTSEQVILTAAGFNPISL